MSSKYVSSKLIKNIKKGGQNIAVEYVDKTTAWTRPEGFPSSTVKAEFAQVAEENVNSLQAATTRVAMKESEHQSDMDKRMHYTAFELDKDGKVIGTQHLVKNK